MKEECSIQKAIDIFARIEEIKKLPGVKVELDEHSHKDYYAIVITATYGNASYSDCAIMYTNEDFDGEEVKSSMNEIVDKIRSVFLNINYSG